MMWLPKGNSEYSSVFPSAGQPWIWRKTETISSWEHPRTSTSTGRRSRKSVVLPWLKPLYWTYLPVQCFSGMDSLMSDSFCTLQVSVCSGWEDLGWVLAHRDRVSDRAAQRDLSGLGRTDSAVHRIRLPAIMGRRNQMPLLCIYINKMIMAGRWFEQMRSWSHNTCAYLQIYITILH